MSPLLASVEGRINPDGSFSFSNILPGNYAARLSLSGLSVGTSISVGTMMISGNEGGAHLNSQIEFLRPHLFQG